MMDAHVAHAPRCVLVTGGAGFIGSNFIRSVLSASPQVAIVNLDVLTYAGNLESLEDVERNHGAAGDGRYTFVRGDIRNRDLVDALLMGPLPNGLAVDGMPSRVDSVVHFAAESHVDRSISGPTAFVETNVNGTLTLLEAARARVAVDATPFRFLQVGTDEVYGSLGSDDPAFTELTPISPNSPYSASKAAADLLARAYFETYGLPTLVTRCSNNYGPYQFPEKLIPLMITRALRNEPLPVYGDGRNVRDWLHVIDHAEALWAVLTRGRPGAVYNIGGESELQNIDIVKRVLAFVDRPESLIRFVTDRPGHDRRYAMDIAKIRRELDWRPRHTFSDGLRHTVAWYLDQRDWWERVLTEAYRTASGMYAVGI